MLEEQALQPTGRDYPELLRSLISIGVDISGRNVMAQINSHDDGTFTLWCVRIEDGRPIYLGRVANAFKTSQEASDQAARLPDDLMDMIEAGRKRH